MERKIIDTISLDGWEINSDTGFCPVKNLFKTVEYEVWNIETENYNLSCADNHILFNENYNQIYVKDLSVGNYIQTEIGIEKVLSVYKTNRIENMYDIEVDTDDHRYYTNNILSHNTTITTCFILWYVLFHPDKKVAVLANKGDSARDIVGRIETAYINLPKWIQSEIVSWNKGSFELGNGSAVIGAATSSDAVRGRSYSCIFIDECAFIPKNIWSKFFTSTWPTISSGKNTRAIIVSTPNGRNHFYDFWIKAKDKKNNFYPMEVNWWDVPGRDDAWKADQLSTMSEEQFMIEYGNSFSATANTLIAPDLFSRLEKNIIVPIQESGSFRIYESPEKNHTYFATVDCSSVGEDYSTISIIDITKYPYKQVAVYADNKISDISFPQIIFQLCKKYNDARVLVESNEIGTAILNILYYDIEYEHVVKTFSIGAGTSRLGQRTTVKTKSLGCSRFKDMVESEMLLIYDKDTFDELRHFTVHGKSFAAETGYHDDLVMGLVNFAYYASSKEFRYQYDENFSDEYRKEYENKVLEDLAPLPLFGKDLDKPDAEDLGWLMK